MNFYKESEGRQIINIAHSAKFEIYFIISDDSKMYIYSQKDFKLIKKINSDIKQSQQLFYLEHLSSFLVIASDCVFLLQVAIASNTRYSTQNSIQLTVTKRTQMEEQLAWVKGQNVQIQQNSILMWNGSDMNVYQIDTLKPIIQLKQLNKKDNAITSAIINQAYQYILVGHNSGKIKVWKYDIWNSSKQMMFTFQEHTRAVLSMVCHSRDPTVFISASSDQTIRFWNIYSFQHLHMYKVANYCYNIQLFSESYFAGFHDQVVSLGSILHYVNFIYKHDTEIRCIDKTYEDFESQMESQSEARLQSVQITLANSSGISFNTKTLKNFNINDVSKNPFAIFYPPPTAKAIVNIITSPYVPGEYLMLVENGELCQFHVQQQQGQSQFSAYIEEIMDLNAIRDDKGTKIGEQISVVKILSILPPRFDMQKGETEQSLQQKADPYDFIYSPPFEALPYLDKIRKLRLVCIGTARGSIIFARVGCQDPVLYTRFTYHRAEIVEIGTLRNQQGQRFFVSVCRDNYLKLTSFDKSRPELVKSIQLMDNFDSIYLFGALFILTQTNGGFNIYQLRHGTTIMTTLLTIGDHEGKILSVDIQKKLDLALTAGSDSKIKFWNYQKQLVFQINYFEMLNFASFVTDEHDILLSSNGSLHILRYGLIEGDVQ